MLCENCNENEATFHYTEVVNGIMTQHHLCSECAAKMGLTGFAESPSADFPFAIASKYFPPIADAFFEKASSQH